MQTNSNSLNSKFNVRSSVDFRYLAEFAKLPVWTWVFWCRIRRVELRGFRLKKLLDFRRFSVESGTIVIYKQTVFNIFEKFGKIVTDLCCLNDSRHLTISRLVSLIAMAMRGFERSGRWFLLSICGDKTVKFRIIVNKFVSGVTL